MSSCRATNANPVIYGDGMYVDEVLIAAWNTRADPVRAALAVPGVADALAWAMRTYTLTDEYGALRADATVAMDAALRTLADAARGSK